MTLPRGSSSGKGRAYLSSACGRPEPEPKKPAVSSLRRTGGPKPSRGKRVQARDSDLSKAWKAAGLALWFPGFTDDDLEVPCPVSGVDLRMGWHPHHILEVKVLHDHGLATTVVAALDRRTGEIVEAPAMYHPFILMPVAPRVNLGFEDGSVQIPRHLVPRWTWDLAAVLDPMDHLAGDEWATQKLLSDYRTETP